MGRGPDALVLVLFGIPDPGQPITAIIDDDLADILEVIRFPRGPHQGLVALAQGPEHAVRLFQGLFGPFALFDFGAQLLRPLFDLDFQVLVGLPQFLLGLPAGPLLLDLQKDPLHRLAQPVEAVLHDVILPSARQNFDGAVFADGARHQDEGGVGAALSRLGQGQGAVVAGKIVVGKDQVRAKPVQAVDEILLPRHHPRREVKPRLFQLELNELRIGRVVFQHENMQGFIHTDRPFFDHCK